MTRNLEAFARFLNEVILSVGHFIDHTKIAKKIKISRHAVPRYFEILEDTMIGYRVFPFTKVMEAGVTISSFRTRAGIEVDFIVETNRGPIAIEVKANDSLSTEDCEGLIFFSKLYPRHSGLFIFHMGTNERKLGPVWALPWQKGLHEIGL